MITKAVIEHTTIVSIKTPNIAISPCLCRSCAFEAAEPNPASLEKIPSETPALTAMPKENPVAACPERAFLHMSLIANTTSQQNQRFF